MLAPSVGPHSAVASGAPPTDGGRHCLSSIESPSNYRSDFGIEIIQEHSYSDAADAGVKCVEISASPCRIITSPCSASSTAGSDLDQACGEKTIHAAGLGPKARMGA